MKDHETVQRARRLRKAMSKPEVMLWRYLRGDPEGLRFRRQHAIDMLVLDFYCPKAKLAIEIDGIAHDMGDQAEFDAGRDARLVEMGIETVRIPAIRVLTDAASVAEQIVRYAAAKLS